MKRSLEPLEPVVVVVASVSTSPSSALSNPSIGNTSKVF